MVGTIKPPLFISHATRSEENTSRARALRRELYDLLSEDWDVFVDDERLLPGDKWRPIILKYLWKSRAAIILFDNWAIEKSLWVTLESLILCFRKSIDPDFQLIPVLLDKLDLKDTPFKEYEPFELEEITIVFDKDENRPIEQLAADTIKGLSLEKAAPMDKELSGWTYKFKLLIAKKENAPLYRAWKELIESAESIEGLDFSAEEISTAIAQLVHSIEPLKALQAIRELNEERFGEAALRQLSGLLKAKWVEIKTVETIFNSVRNPEKLSLLTYPIWTGNRDYFIDSLFERIQIECPDNFTIYTCGVSGAAGETDDAIIFQIDKAIKSVPQAIYDVITGSGRAPVGSQAQRLLRGKTVLMICHLPSELARIEVLKRIRERYPKVIFLVSFKSSEEAAGLKPHGGKMLVPINEGNIYDFDFFAGELKKYDIDLKWESLSDEY